ncbi:MAG: sensor histidine kinase [Herpetosiphonaceae bacterium]|nr:MAG: sensor histidine kinase [Herpetosiphonaceae bacterium]
MNSILMVQVDPSTSAMLRMKTSILQDTVLEEVASPEQLLKRLQHDQPRPDALVLGSNLESPVQLVQRIYALDRDVAVLILSEPEQQKQLIRALQFAPFIGEDVSCRSVEEHNSLGQALQEAMIRTRLRRRYRLTAAAVSSKLSDLGIPRRNPTSYIDQLLDHAPIGIIAVDTQGTIFAWNRKAGEILERTERDALGLPLAQLFPAPMRDELLSFIDTGLSTSEEQPPRIFERVTAAGEQQFVEITTAALTGNDGEPGALVLFADVTARVIAERERAEALRLRDELLHREQAARAEAEAAQRRFAFLAEAGSNLISSLDYQERLQTLARLAVPFLADWCIVDIIEHDGTISRVAVAAALHEKEALLHELRQRYPPTWDSPQPAAVALRSGKPLLIRTLSAESLAAMTRDIAHLEIIRSLDPRSAMAVPLIARNDIIGAITFALSESGRIYGPEDLSFAEELARRTAIAVDNARLYSEAQQALRIRDQFLSIAAHELKTPVTALLGYAQLLQRRAGRKGDMDERNSRALRALYEQAHRLHRLIVSLLDLSRIQLGQLIIERQIVDLAGLAQRIAEETQAISSRHIFQVKITSAPLLVEGDELRLEQVLLNLLHNAIKYSPEGGTITLRVERKGHQVEIAISDQGIGIPSDALPHLFDRFFRAGNADRQQFAGMGLGLFVVKEIVTLHGGTISVSSKEGQGSTFTIQLPLKSEDSIEHFQG